MKKFKRSFLTRLSSGQSGQALILVMIFLLLGGLTLVPTLTNISTALKAGQTYEQNTNELYTADSGVEDALWRIKYDFMGPDYNPYDFSSSWPYQTEDINGMTANFTVSNVWFPTDVNLVDPFAPGYINMTPDEVKEMMDSEKLIVAGSALPGQPYRVLIDFNPDAGNELTIKSLGVWLPRGFTYTDNSCSLQVGGHTHSYNPDHVTVAEAPGGTTILWSYDGPNYPDLSDFPGYDSGEYTFDFTFSYTPPPYTPPEEPQLPAAIAWVSTQMLISGVPQPASPENVPVSWDIDTRYFKITSDAGDASIEAYSSKNELRQLGDAISGDYVAIGNSLLADDNGDHKRETWHAPSSYTVDSIPSDADVIYAFLYWAGWRNENAVQSVFSDTCSNFNNWVRNAGGIQTQTQVPTSDGINAGTWSSTPASPADYYSRVDETTPNDADYITGLQGNQIKVPTGDGHSSGSWSRYPSTPYNYYSRVDETTPDESSTYITGTDTSYSGAYRTFTFDDFTVPDGATINSLTVYFRAKDASSGTNNLRAYLRIDSDYYSGSSVDPGTGWTTYSYTWNVNPDTGSPWTTDQINQATGSHELQEFGIYSSDFNPDIQVTMVYAEVSFSGGYRLFDFQDFTVPSNSEIDSLTVYFRARDAGSGPNSLSASIYVTNTRYDASTSVDPGADWTTYSYTFSDNPETGNPWTWQEINGGSSHPLLQFGVSSTDFNPDIDISMVYAEARYYESRWVVTSNQFEGQGTGVVDPDSRVLTLKNGINLSSSGIFNISWDQSESGNLSDGDIFSYAFSGDGGVTWSPYYEAFRGNDPASPFTTTIPDDYLTNNFKVRFYFNFDASSKSVFVDNIRITYLPIDTEVAFKINGQQVYFNGSEPAVGPQNVIAERSYAMLNTMWGDPYGFSYMCVKDVSALVKKYPVVAGEEHHTGNAQYTVGATPGTSGNVDADIRNPDNSLSDFAFSGWSLIIVYASPESAGHYIYIRDDNFAFHPGTGGNLDFDEDGTPGGTIRDFIVPNPITDKYGHIVETVAAKITCFAVEGDDFGNDTSSIVVTGQQSGLSKNLTEPVGRINDVINSRSWPGTFNEGVDIDTFEIKWSDGILTPKDKQLQVDMYSLNDAWNLVYFIISIRSETVTSGTTYYTITGG